VLAERTPIAWLAALQSIADLEVRLDHPLAGHTSFRIGGPAQCFASPLNESAALELWQVARRYDVQLTVLGGGTNVLIADAGIEGIVVDLCRGFAHLDEAPRADGSSVWTVGAGCGTGRMVRRAVSRGLRGVEVLAGVPGSLGGALIMNAGGHDGEIGTVVESVRIINDGAVQTLTHDAIGFSYRASRFPSDALILEGRLHLTPGDKDALRDYVRASQTRRKSSQPLTFGNAGSIFKNPPDDFAGRLIDAAGCKGWQEGDAEVSELHANFIINRGKARARDVAVLAKRVRDAVLAASGITLEFEVKFLGRFDAGEQL